jgi:aspartokinase
METEAVQIIDGIPHELSCQSGITQIKLLADHPFSSQEIQTVFQTASNYQISLQRIDVHGNQIVFSIPFATTGGFLSLFNESDYHIQTVQHCAAINISIGQIDDIPEITATVIETLNSVDVPILQLITTQSFLSVLVEQCHLPKVRTTLGASLSPF